MRCRLRTLLILALAISGCAQSPPPVAKPQPVNPEHGHLGGPHGGTLADFGHSGEFHVEFTVDHDKQEATVYVVGKDAKTPAPLATDKLSLVIKQPLTEIDLLPQPLDGEQEGNSSRFVGRHANLGKVQEFEGRIQGIENGVQQIAYFSETPHAH